MKKMSGGVEKRGKWSEAGPVAALTGKAGKVKWLLEDDHLIILIFQVRSIGIKDTL